MDTPPVMAGLDCALVIWMNRPYYNDHPRDQHGIEMNAMIRNMGRIWTLIPGDEIPKVKKALNLPEEETTCGTD